MNFKMAFAAAALTLMGASAAQAQLVITLDNPVQSTTVPNFVTFSGLIENNEDELTGLTYTIEGDSVSAPAGVIPDLPHSDLIIGSWPHSLAPGGDTFYGDWLFGLEIPASQTESFGGTYAITGTDSQGNPFQFSVDYRVNIQGGGVVPEPGTMALLVSGLVGGSLVFKRRRK